MLAVLPADFPQGRQFIIVDEWGPFDFRRPIATLDTLAGNLYSLALIGPSGDWRITSMKGLKTVSAKQGIVPSAITLERDPASDGIEVVFDYISPQAVTTVFGEKIAAGRPYQFDFKRFEKKLQWKLKFFNYTGELPGENIFSEKPVAEQSVDDLYFAWWGKPAEGVNEEKFASESSTTVDMAPGEYTIDLTSDDGVRLYLDGKIILDHWNVHEPETDELTVSLGGRHSIRVEHFEAGGFSTLGFRIRQK